MRNNNSTNFEAFNNNGRSLPPIGYNQLSTGSMPTGFRPENQPKPGIVDGVLSFFGLQRQEKKPVVQQTPGEQKLLLASEIESELTQFITVLDYKESELTQLRQEIVELEDIGKQLGNDGRTPRSKLDEMAEEWDDLSFQIETRERELKPLATQKRLAKNLIRDLRNPEMSVNLPGLIEAALELLQKSRADLDGFEKQVQEQQARYRSANGRDRVVEEAYDPLKEDRTSRFLAACQRSTGRDAPTHNPFRQREGIGGRA